MYLKGGRILLIAIFLILFFSCGSKINQLSYAVNIEPDTFTIIKSDLITLDGIIVLNISADSGHIVIDYNRLECSQDIIESKFETLNLEYTLMTKEKL